MSGVFGIKSSHSVFLSNGLNPFHCCTLIMSTSVTVSRRIFKGQQPQRFLSALRENSASALPHCYSEVHEWEL